MYIRFLRSNAALIATITVERGVQTAAVRLSMIPRLADARINPRRSVPYPRISAYMIL